MRSDDLPLFDWKPECRFIPFPPQRRVGKIRDVAAKWLAQRTEGLAKKYAAQINGDLQEHFSRLGILPDERKRLTDEFWNAVRAEISNQRGQKTPGGSAA